MLHTDIPQLSRVHLGIAGWNIRREHTPRFPTVGTHLQRYAAVFNAVEINSCFYRPHRSATYERWAASVPETFRFSVKLPKAITHGARLVDITVDLERFLEETSGLGAKRGPILVQLPPSFAYDARVAECFFDELRLRFDGDVAFEPRHETWFSDEVDTLLRRFHVARVAADPARVPIAAKPGGCEDLAYYRLHGSPRVYYSAYPADVLGQIAAVLDRKASAAARVWCIFDNTALGAATSDALTVQSLLSNTQSSFY